MQAVLSVVIAEFAVTLLGSTRTPIRRRVSANVRFPV